jgi:hypothetical protein
MHDIDHHLPFAANEELRSDYKKQFDAIRVAHQRIWDGEAMDEAFSPLCTAESEAMYALVETAPTTVRGLLALLS